MNVFQNILNNEKFDELNNMVRWNGMGRIKDETVAHHTFMVVWFARIMAEEMFSKEAYKVKNEILTYAIFHDFDEMFTGDVNHNLKYNRHNGQKIRENLDQYIELTATNFFSNGSDTDNLMLDNISACKVYVKHVVKICDWLSMCFYLKKEINLGNKSVARKLDYCVESLIYECERSVVYFTEKSTKLAIKELKILEDIQEIDWTL